MKLPPALADRPEREKDVQRRVVALCRSAGCHVANLSQARPSHVALGLPDLYVFPPPDSRAQPFWVEVKRRGGVQSPAQRDWQARCQQARVPYVLGGFREALRHLIDAGLWRLPLGVSFERVAGPPWR